MIKIDLVVSFPHLASLSLTCLPFYCVMYALWMTMQTIERMEYSPTIQSRMESEIIANLVVSLNSR